MSVRVVELYRVRSVLVYLYVSDLECQTSKYIVKPLELNES